MFAAVQDINPATRQTFESGGLHLARGQQGTAQTLALIAEAARSAARDPAIRALAQGIVANAPEKDWQAEAEAVQEWVADNIRYGRDTVRHEVIQTARLTLARAAGDCDDQTILVAALLASIGHSVRATAIGRSPGKFEHVFCEVVIGRRWLSVETTEDWPIGYRLPGIVSVMSRVIFLAPGINENELAGFGSFLKKVGRQIDRARRDVTGAVTKVLSAADPTGITGKVIEEAHRVGRKVNEEFRRAFVDIFPVVLTVVSGGSATAIAIAIATAAYQAQSRSRLKQQMEQVAREEQAYYDQMISEANEAVADTVALDLLQRRGMSQDTAEGASEYDVLRKQVKAGIEAGQDPATAAATVIARSEMQAAGVNTAGDEAKADLVALVEEVKAQLINGVQAKNVTVPTYEEAVADGTFSPAKAGIYVAAGAVGLFILGALVA